MIGHYVNTFTAMQQGSVLTQKLRPGRTRHADGARCLVGAAAMGGDHPQSVDWRGDFRLAVGCRYDDLCTRFGEPRVNAAIRNRILANQARRVLAPRREVVSEVA